MTSSVTSVDGSAALAKIAPVPAIEVRGLTTGYGDTPVLEGVDLVVSPGALVGVIGPNGGGKSTLFKTILGLHRPWSGTIAIEGRDGKPGPAVAYVPQAETVDWSFPVRVSDVVMMGRYPRLGVLRRPGRHDRELVRTSLEQVGMLDHADRQIGQLSGGQRQRVFLARALAQGSNILLLDEPVSGVDAITQHQVFELLERLCAAGKTALVASHDLSCVAQRFDQVLLLNDQVVAYGPPATVLTQELLNRTFKSHLLLLQVDGRTFVVEDAAHVHRH
jgi:ABC-type Mn2+/Zn2+ transport system ATPase subunit